MSVLSCRGVSLGYEGRIIAENINFDIEQGDYVCITGENGSGKSTLIKAILGLLPHAAGTITEGDGVKHTEIGYLPQQTDIQRDFPASVWEIVLSGCQSRAGMRPFYNREEKQTAESNIEKTGLSALKKRCYRELSGGQQQRVLLARALCAARKMILLDEPAAALDPMASAEMYGLINKINKEDKITVLMVSHDVASALKYADKLLHIGETVFFGNRDEYVKNVLSKGFMPGGGND
ncbi:MAG: ABC transporter ATP-binding protein [Clostridia bacterium]|nr:ABC transporter ATP-binding protein [Clostridia bacterium]